MNISFRWLARHVDLDGLTPADVANDLTIHTAEVEGVEPFAPHLADVVVGHVVERERHPDADKLNLCRVDIGPAGSGELLQIVCGAPNVDRGQRVAVARIGTRLPGGIKLKKSKIRGVESQGMICSLRELELGDDHSGIWVLPDDVTLGVDVSTACGLDDHVIEIDNKSLTHRPDLWGHRGIAGEIAALRGRKLRPLDFGLPKTKGGDPYPVRIETEGCSRYIGLAIDGLKNGAAPAWMRHLLLAVGQRPIDLCVDLSNFVMLDLGQPNHLFDRRRLSPEGIVVRDAHEGETMATLDEVERRLGPEDMLITSGGEAVAIAGVMGGEASKVTADTTELLLEVASFHPTTVRRTSARIGLRTDASARFEKSLDPTLPAKAAAHLVNLLREIQPDVSFPRPPGDVGSWKDPACKVTLRPERVRAILGADIPDDDVATKLESLGFGVKRAKASWTVSVPSARATKDVGIEEDLIEEVGRLYGYGEIDERVLQADIVPPPRDDRRALVRTLQDRLSGAALYHEAMTHTFHSDELLAALKLADEPHLEVRNPVIEGYRSIRRSVLPSLVSLLAHNRRQRAEFRLYEIGKGYRPETANEAGEPREVHELALVHGRAADERKGTFPDGLFHHMQALVADLVACADRAMPAWERGGSDEAPSVFHPGKWIVAKGRDGEVLARVGELEPGLARDLGLEGELASEVALAEVSLDALLVAEAQPLVYRPIARFPAVKVDVAVAIAENVSAGDVAAAIEGAGKGLVDRLDLFDLYRGENLGAGRKSLAYHVSLQAADKTLGEKEIQKFLGRVERAFERLGGELRRDTAPPTG